MLRVAKVSMILLIGILIFTGCSRTGSTPVVAPTDERGADTPESPVKLITLIDYPEGEGGKDTYLQWFASIAPTLQAPEEVLRIRAYDNVKADMSPHRLVAFEFKSFLDAATYMNRPEIAAIFEDLPNRSPKFKSHTFIQRSVYQKIEAVDAPVIGVVLINYRPGGRDAYLQWAASVGSTLVAQPELQTLSVYENYYGEPPHRLLEGTFASHADADAFNASAEILAIEAELDTQAESWIEYRFELRSDYISQ